ncbi:group II intron maturase-specific domain-containing protein [Enterobacter ludwigii]
MKFISRLSGMPTMRLCSADRWAHRGVLCEKSTGRLSGGLTLHPEKTKLVYCKDRRRKADYPVTSSDFLAYRFQARGDKRREGFLFLNLLPAVSTKAARTKRGRIRRWKIYRWTQLAIKELAKRINPVLRGRLNYYGKFCKSKRVPIFGQLNYSPVRWARRKYKRLGSASQATTWLRRVVAQLPGLFAHRTIIHAGKAGRQMPEESRDSRPVA